MSFGSLCGCRFYATVKVDAVHGFPTEESIIPLGSQRERGRGGGGKLDKRRVVTVGTTLRKRPGLVERRAGSYVLSTANGVFFLLFLSKMFSLLCCTSTRHGIMSAHDRLVFAINTFVDSNQHLEIS